MVEWSWQMRKMDQSEKVCGAKLTGFGDTLGVCGGGAGKIMSTFPDYCYWQLGILGKSPFWREQEV